MRYLLFVAILVLLYLPFSTSKNVEDQPEDYSGIEVYLNNENNVCQWQRPGVADISITVNYIEPSDEIDYYGQWRPAENLIVLNKSGGLNLGTVAHEVYHVVETKMEEHRIADPHWGAYIQGGLTNCVWELVLADVLR